MTSQDMTVVLVYA